MGVSMNLHLAILLSAVLIALSIAFSPILLQGYKMFQCVSAMEKSRAGSQETNQLTCMQYIN